MSEHWPFWKDEKQNWKSYFCFNYTNKCKIFKLFYLHQVSYDAKIVVPVHKIVKLSSIICKFPKKMSYWSCSHNGSQIQQGETRTDPDPRNTFGGPFKTSRRIIKVYLIYGRMYEWFKRKYFIN